MYSKKSVTERRTILKAKKDKAGHTTQLVAVQSIMDDTQDKWFTVWAVERVYLHGDFQYWVYPTEEQAERSYNYDW